MPKRFSPKYLLLIRHAHRDKNADGDGDNGLSEKGKNQAAALTAHILEKYPGKKFLIQSSPARRCVETVKPIALSLKLRIRKNKLLAEEGESRSDFLMRIAQFRKWCEEKAPPSILACSHGDWIPQFLRETTGLSTELKKGALAEIQLTERTWFLRQIWSPIAGAPSIN